MIVVLIIPTGVGAEIGGHAGDGNPVAKLIASTCDKLITHPNVVNASDINEMTENTLYVEGSMLDRFLEGSIGLREVKSNKVLVAVNSPVRKETINAVSAARATVGLNAEIIELNTPLKLIAIKDKYGCATGDVFGWKELIAQVRDYDFDALAVSTPIEVDREIAYDYLTKGGVNPWGGVEARTSALISHELNKPVAHAPMGHTFEFFNEVVDPRMSAEMVSVCYLHCILKGLHKAPQVGYQILHDDVSCLITPVGCMGRPHYACLEHGIPIIAVNENKTCLNYEMPEDIIVVDNYWEAAGYIMCMKSGIDPRSVRRPLKPTNIICAREPVGEKQ